MTSPNEGFYIPFLPCSCCQCWKQSPNKEILRDRNVPVTAISSLLRRAWICVTSDSLSMRIAILTISVVPGRYQYYYHEANDKLSFHSHIPFGGVCSWSGNCLDMTSSYGKNVSATSSLLLPRMLHHISVNLAGAWNVRNSSTVNISSAKIASNVHLRSVTSDVLKLWAIDTDPGECGDRNHVCIVYMSWYVMICKQHFHLGYCSRFSRPDHPLSQKW